MVMPTIAKKIRSHKSTGTVKFFDSAVTKKWINWLKSKTNNNSPLTVTQEKRPDKSKLIPMTIKAIIIKMNEMLTPLHCAIPKAAAVHKPFPAVEIMDSALPKATSTKPSKKNMSRVRIWLFSKRISFFILTVAFATASVKIKHSLTVQNFVKYFVQIC